LAAGLFILVSLLIDFFPRHAPPDFRYTGSDPTFIVWNLGWPLALFIYDSRNGFHVGPEADMMLPFQGFVFMVGMAIALIWRRHTRANR